MDHPPGPRELDGPDGEAAEDDRPSWAGQRKQAEADGGDHGAGRRGGDRDGGGPAGEGLDVSAYRFGPGKQASPAAADRDAGWDAGGWAGLGDGLSAGGGAGLGDGLSAGGGAGLGDGLSAGGGAGL